MKFKALHKLKHMPMKYLLITRFEVFIFAYQLKYI